MLDINASSCGRVDGPSNRRGGLGLVRGKLPLKIAETPFLELQTRVNFASSQPSPPPFPFALISYQQVSIDAALTQELAKKVGSLETLVGELKDGLAVQSGLLSTKDVQIRTLITTTSQQNQQIQALLTNKADITRTVGELEKGVGKLEKGAAAQSDLLSAKGGQISNLLTTTISQTQQIKTLKITQAETTSRRLLSCRTFI